ARGLLFSFLLAMPMSDALAQSLADRLHLTESPAEAYRGLAVGAGTTIIDGTPYFLLHVAPQVQYGQWGFGIDGDILISTAGQFRKEDWDNKYDYMRWFNYASFGFPHDDFYVRFGGIEHATIGNGTIVSDYWNNSSYDDRRLGGVARVDLGFVGAEGLSSDFFHPGLIAVRPFARPFQLLPVLANSWFLSNIQVGVTGAFDFDTNASRLIPNHAPYVERVPDPSDLSDTIDEVITDSARYALPLTTYGADISTMLWKSDKTEGRLYGDYVKFQNFNHGVMIGARSAFYAADSVLLDLRAERDLFKDQFVPSYYNSFYERDRFDDQAGPANYITKLTLLHDSAGGNGNGFKGGAFLNYYDNVQFEGSFLHLDNLPGEDWMQLELVLPHLPHDIYFRLLYTREEIAGWNDLFALDDRSMMMGEITYKLWKWLLLIGDFQWSFAVDASGHLHTETVIQPRADVIIKF
ncbi:MAG TPA: hypothetical protein VGM92_10085, partial [Candidatus Kapabacteria bacterium]